VTLTVRPAAREDVESVLRLWDATVVDRSIPDGPDDVHRMILRDPEALLVAEEDGRVVGTLIAGWDGWRGNLYRLAVDPEWRRRGVASALVRDAELRLRARGCRRVTALLMGDRDDAIGLWRSAGYEADSRAVRFVKNLGEIDG
jgi:ribosomal protein S18 acetylase RimI-like enzyme